MLYRPLLETGDSSPYFGTYEGQKYLGYDTNCCWDFSGAELLETHQEMNQKLGLIPADTIEWAKSNGFIDESGNWYVSRRWVAILSGVKDNGNYQLNFWEMVKKYGIIPDKMLPYSAIEASKWITKNQFNNDYFNRDLLTPEMYALGQEFLRRFSVDADNIPGGYLNDISVELQEYLKEGSLQIGHPVPQDGSWNRVNVDYPKGRTVADHATELYKYDPSLDYPFCIYDSYEPHLKQLSKNYYIPYITRVSIVPYSTPLIPLSSWMKFWFNLSAIFNGNPQPFPSVPVGKSK